MDNRELTFEECASAHYRLWDELSRTGGSTRSWSEWDKTDYDRYYQGVLITNNCFACYVCNVDCKRCPIDWGIKKSMNCMHFGAPCYRWIFSQNVEEKKKYAAIIRDLPFVKMRKSI